MPAQAPAPAAFPPQASRLRFLRAPRPIFLRREAFDALQKPPLPVREAALRGRATALPGKAQQSPFHSARAPCPPCAPWPACGGPARLGRRLGPPRPSRLFPCLAPQGPPKRRQGADGPLADATALFRRPPQPSAPGVQPPLSSGFRPSRLRFLDPSPSFASGFPRPLPAFLPGRPGLPPTGDQNLCRRFPEKPCGLTGPIRSQERARSRPSPRLREGPPGNRSPRPQRSCGEASTSSWWP